MTAPRDRELSLIDHLEELRRRLYVVAIAIFIGTVVAFIFSEQLVRFLLAPSGVERCIALSPTENFTTFMHVSLFAGIAFAMVVILYEVYAYIDPALLPAERRYVIVLGPFVLGLFVAGMAFCYFLLLPNSLRFLVNFGSAVIDNQLRCSEYLSFVTTFILGMGIVFEVPAIMFVVIRVGVVRRARLAGLRRYVFLAAFVIAALLTPTPDPFNQTLVALPLYVLFEVGLLLGRFAERSRAAA